MTDAKGAPLDAVVAESLAEKTQPLLLSMDESCFVVPIPHQPPDDKVVAQLQVCLDVQDRMGLLENFCDPEVQDVDYGHD